MRSCCSHFQFISILFPKYSIYTEKCIHRLDELFQSKLNIHINTLSLLSVFTDHCIVEIFPSTHGLQANSIQWVHSRAECIIYVTSPRYLGFLHYSTFRKMLQVLFLGMSAWLRLWVDLRVQIPGSLTIFCQHLHKSPWLSLLGCQRDCSPLSVRLQPGLCHFGAPSSSGRLMSSALGPPLLPSPLPAGEHLWTA